MKLDIKNKHQMQSLLRLTIRDAAPEKSNAIIAGEF